MYYYLFYYFFSSYYFNNVLLLLLLFIILILIFIYNVEFVVSKFLVFARDFSRLNEDSALNDFETIQWQDVLSESQNVNQLFNVFFSKCSEIVNKHLPMRKLSRREVKFKSKS